MREVTFYLIALLLLISLPEVSEAQWISYETRTVGKDLNVPWEIRWGHDNWIWFTERAGRFAKIHPDSGRKKTLLHFADVDHTTAERGVLGFDFHPDFPDSPFIYIAHNYVRGDTVGFNVFRWTYRPDTLIDPTPMLQGLPSGDIHNGSRVVIGPDRKLYISTGEQDIASRAQDIHDLGGKILRIELDGSVPLDNPIAGNPIWTWGHRNPQGLTFGPTGILYSTEHGHAKDDEFNILEKGRNYGWPRVEGYCDNDEERALCEQLDVVPAVLAWTPTLAVTGIEYADRVTFPEWKNSILLATLKDRSLWVLKLDDNGREVIETYRYPLIYSSDSAPIKRLRDFCFSPDGRLFVSTSNIWSKEWTPDKIIEIRRVDVIPFEVKLLSPMNGETSYSGGSMFRWTRCLADSRYQVQIARRHDFITNCIFDSVVRDTSVTISLGYTEENLYWRAREVTSNGPWSAIDSFAFSPKRVDEKGKVTKYRKMVREHLTFDTSGVEGGKIINVAGEVVAILTEQNRSSGSIDLRGLSTGTYFLCLDHDDSTVIIPFTFLRY
jgi:aldose sugar dehydrogenase